jgi:hypothetical protein
MCELSPRPPRTDSGEPATLPEGGRARGPIPPWLADLEQRLQKTPTLWDTLTEEDWEFFRNYDGPEVLGPPPPPPMKRRPRRRGET